MHVGSAGALALAFVLAACGNDSDDSTGTADDSTDAGTTEAAPEVEVDDGWSPGADAPTALTEVGAAAFEGELWTVGGLTEAGTVTDEVQIYDPAADEWRAGPALPDPVHHTAVVATDSDLLVVGGYRTLDFDPIADVYVLDQENETWVDGPDLPEPRGAGAAAWDGERVVYGGGVGAGTGGDGLSDAILALTGPDDTWTEIGALSIARDHLAAASDGQGTVWFLGGRELDMGAILGTVDALRGEGVEPTTELPTPRGGVAAFFSPEHGACLVGGEAPAGTFDEVECVDADGTVTALPSLEEARHGLGADVIDGVAYVVLGGPEPGLAVSSTTETLAVG